jgi:hypothetical protein
MYFYKKKMQGAYIPIFSYRNIQRMSHLMGKHEMEFRQLLHGKHE